MPINWPAYLQDFINAAGFSENIGETVLRTEMEIGPAKLRRRFTDSIDVVNSQITVYMDVMNQFKTFFKTNLNGGVTPFYFTDPTTGLVATYRFVGTPSIAPNGTAGYFDISMQWEKVG